MARINGLPLPLHRTGQSTGTCKICDSPTELFDVVDFNKLCSRTNFYRYGLSGIQVAYDRCDSCELIFTRFFDEWTQADLAECVYNADYIKVDPDYAAARPRFMANDVSAFLRGYETESILDYGSGSGTFERLLREKGYSNIVSYDPFSMPERPKSKFRIITAFEVIEHSPDPLGTLEDMKSLLSNDGIIIASTSVQPPDIDKIRCNWWFVGPRNGHCSIYSRHSLSEMARIRRLHAGSGGHYHAFWPSGSEMFRALGISPTIHMSLRAPDQEDVAWQGREKHPRGGRFRWSRSKTLSWSLHLELDGTMLSLEIPVLMEIEANFLARTQVSVDGIIQSSSLKATDQGYVLKIAPVRCKRDVDVVMTTPDPVRPLDRGGKDERFLGLAVKS